MLGRPRKATVFVWLPLLVLSVIAISSPRLASAGFFDPSEYNQAVNAYKAGDNITACEQLAKLLRRKDHKKATKMMEEVAPLVWRDFRTKGSELESAKRWDDALPLYRRAVQLSGDITALNKGFKAEDFGPDVQRVLSNAAKAHYDEGVTDLAQQRGEEAVKAFQRSAELIPGYQDVDAKIATAKEAAATQYYEKGDHLAQAGKHKEAAMAFRTSSSFIAIRDAAERYDAEKKLAIQKICLMDIPYPMERFPGLTGFIAGQVTTNLVNAQPEFLETVSAEGLGLAHDATASTLADTAKKMGINDFIKAKVVLLTVSEPRSVLVAQDSRPADPQHNYAGYAYKVFYKSSNIRTSMTYQIIDAVRATSVASESIEDQQVTEDAWAQSTVSCEYTPNDKISLPNGREVFLQSLCSKGEGALDPPEILVEKTFRSLANKLSQKILDRFK
jgi:hypothetical protein